LGSIIFWRRDREGRPPVRLRCRPVRAQLLRDVAAASTLSESERDPTIRVGLLALDGDEDLEVR